MLLVHLHQVNQHLLISSLKIMLMLLIALLLHHVIQAQQVESSLFQLVQEKQYLILRELIFRIQ